MLKYRKTCRLCGSSHLERILNLGKHSLHGSFIYPNKIKPPNRKIPVEILFCNPEYNENGCGLLQLSVTTPPEFLFDDYGYRSSTNDTMRCHLDLLANEINKTIDLNNKIVLDIGCNNGYLLSKLDKCYKIGIDPSEAIDEMEEDDRARKIKDLFPSIKLQDYKCNKRIDVIISCAMFYDLETPQDFIKEIKEMLSYNGIIILEFGYLVDVLLRNAWDYFCHEHLCCYSFSTLEWILNKFDLKCFKIIRNDINGGSIQCWITHKENNFYDKSENLKNIKELKVNEFNLELDRSETYYNFGRNVQSHISKIRDFVFKENAQGKVFHLMGASTKTNLVIQSCELNNKQIQFASDRSNFKNGAKTLGTDIPIISENESRILKPDYYFTCIYFKEEILEREKEYLNNGGKFLFIFPELHIVSKDGILKL